MRINSKNGGEIRVANSKSLPESSEPDWDAEGGEMTLLPPCKGQ